MVLPETSLARGIEVAERLCAGIRSLEIPEAGKITVSIGLAELPSSARGSDELKSAADAALYEAKHAGRDQVRCAFAPIEPNQAPMLGVSTK